MPASIALTINRTLVPLASTNQSGYKLTMSAVGTGIDSNVFTFQRGPVTPESIELIDSFYSIASVGQMEDLAVGDPAEDSSYYREDSIELVFESQALLDEYEEKIRWMLKELAVATEKAETMGEPETVIITS